jgi:hypothetical protein
LWEPFTVRYLWSFIARVMRALGILPPEKLNPASPTIANRAGRAFARTRMSVVRVLAYDEGGEACGWLYAGDPTVTGFGNAARVAQRHAADAGPGEYWLATMQGDQIARLWIDEDCLIHVIEWCDPVLLARHEREAAARAAPVLSSTGARRRAA